MRNLIIPPYNPSIWWVFTLILGIASLTFSSCSTPRAIRLRNKNIKAWEAYELNEIKKGPDNAEKTWTIYSRKIKGTSLIEYKIEGEIEAIAKTCVGAFRQDILDQAADVKNKKYPTYEIVKESKDSLLTYVIHNEPFPFKDTEMSVRYIFFHEEDGSSGVIWQEAWEESEVQLSKKLKRVETFRGSWSFTPTSAKACQAVNSVQFDPKGMPEWLFKPMVIKFLKNGLTSLREGASK